MNLSLLFSKMLYLAIVLKDALQYFHNIASVLQKDSVNRK